MEHDPLEKFFRESQNISLSEEKKRSIEREILDFVKQHPPAKPEIQKRGPLPWFPLNFFQTIPLKIVLASLIGIILIGGFTSAKAAFALPGDALYPIKIGLNEKVQEAFVLQSEAKTNLQISLAEERLKETEQLMIGGILTPENQLEVENNFKVHINESQKGIEKLHTQGKHDQAQSASENLEATLRAHQLIIDQLQRKASQQSPQSLLEHIQTITAAVSEGRNDISKKSTAATTTTDSQNMIQKKMSDVEKSIAKVRQTLQKDGSIENDTRLQSENNLKLVEEKINESKNNNEHQKSLEALGEAEVLAKETGKLLDTRHRLKFDININISGNENK